MSFDRLAPHYRWMEAVLAGGLLQRCRTRWLADVGQPRRALLVGEGNGRMLVECARALPGCEFLVLDQSQAMLAQARRNWEKTGANQSVVFQQTDLREWRAGSARFDLLITNFVLDCFSPTELRRVIANLRAAALPNARWLLADFTVPATGWQRLRARALLVLAYGFFRCATGISASSVADPGELLRAEGFVLQRQERFNHGLLRADLWMRHEK